MPMLMLMLSLELTRSTLQGKTLSGRWQIMDCVYPAGVGRWNIIERGGLHFSAKKARDGERGCCDVL
jgi:hypothetical protein